MLKVDGKRKKCSNREWKRNGPATANCHSGCGLDAEGSAYKQGRESTYSLGHKWTLLCPLHCMLSQQKRWGVIVKLEMLDKIYFVKAFVDPVYALRICVVWWSGTISIVKTVLQFAAETRANLYLGKENNFPQSHNRAITFVLLMKNSTENWKLFCIPFSFFMMFLRIHQ